MIRLKGITMLTDEYVRVSIERMRAEGKDDELCEAKTCQSTLGESVWESVSAFANTHGGLLLLGVSEKEHFKPAKGFPIEKVSAQFMDGMGDGSRSAQKVFPAPHYDTHETTIDGVRILAVQIEELPAEKKPCSVEIKGTEQGAYKRIGDRDIRLTAAEIYELRSVATPGKADVSAVEDASIDDLDPHDIERLIDQVVASGSRAFAGCATNEERLVRLHVLGKEGSVTLAGLLCLGFFPQQFRPSLVIDVAVHPGTEKGSNPDILFLDRRICDGSMPEAIDDALQTIFRNLRIISSIEGSERIERHELPMEVVREALVNAVIHREYAALFLGQPIHVDVFADRIEITNPGGLWGGVSLHNLGDGISRCRNPELLRLLRDYTNPDSKGPFVEGNGTGIQAMRARLKREGLPKPRFEASIDQFKVILPRPEASGSKAHAQERVEAALARIVQDPAFQETMETVKRATDSAAQQRILELISAIGTASVQDLAEALGKTVTSLRPQLRALVDAGLIDATAPTTSKKRRYRIAGEGSEEASA